MLTAPLGVQLHPVEYPWLTLSRLRGETCHRAISPHACRAMLSKPCMSDRLTAAPKGRPISRKTDPIKSWNVRGRKHAESCEQLQ